MRCSRRPSPHRRSGFTLIEVLLVLVILVVIGSLVGLQVTGARKRAMINAARTQIGMFKTPLANFQLDMGTYPTTAHGLQSLLTCPSDVANSTKYGGPYLTGNKVPLDPWDKPYQYASPGRRNADYDVWSLGPDGADGTDDDIGNW